MHLSVTDTLAAAIADPPRYATFGSLGRVCRLALATRGNTRLEPRAVRAAIDRGINYLNWCGQADGLSAAIRSMSRAERSRVIVSVQLSARSCEATERELAKYLTQLGTDYIDIVTYYYVEQESQWEQIVADGGAGEALERAKTAGTIRAIGLTSHQRRLAARIATSGGLDMLMIRYNAAHRGAEQDVFPVTGALGMPVAAFTAQRWGALMRATPDDPAGFAPPDAQQCYRFVLCQPAVTVVLMAPDGSAQLEQNLKLLDDWHGMTDEQYNQLRAHGDRVRRHAGEFV